MFDKLSKREKVLASATAGAFAVALLFGGFFWFMGSYNANVSVLQGIETQFGDEDGKTVLGIKADKRKRYYLDTSLTSKASDAKNQYIAWLKKTFREDVGVNINGVDLGRGVILKQDGVTVAEQMLFTVKPKLTLKELVKFLDAFYSVDALHRISTLNLKPITEKAGSERTRTGQISATIVIHALSMIDGMSRDQLPLEARDPGMTLDEAMASIVRRDVFGAANNSPTLKVNKSSSYTSEKTATIKVSAGDADDEDQLTMELIESAVEGAEINVEKDGRKGTLVVPGQKAGRYKFLLRVTDNGLPEKSTDQSFEIVFKDPAPPKKPKKKEPKPPALKMAVETRITGNLRNRDGSWSVLIKSRMDGQSYRLKVGESFTLDKEEWEVTDINAEIVKFVVGGEEISVDRGTAFSDAR